MLYFLLAIVLISVLLYFMPVIVRIDVKKDNKNDNVTIGIRTLYGLVKLKSEIPFLMIVFENGKPALKYKLEIANKKRSKLFARFTKMLSLSEGEGVLALYKRNKNRITSIIKYMARKTQINDFNMKLGLGAGDAAATGILYGVTWIVIGNIMTFAQSHLNLYEPRIAIVPVFTSYQLTVDFSCIINLKLGHIINAGISAIPVLISSTKE